ncbi:DUF1841 family protein [soil metagenome]
MIFSNERSELRGFYFEIWRKYHAKEPLEPLEQQLLAIMLDHPEFHTMFNDPDKYTDKDYQPIDGVINPFLHMAVHHAIHDQISLNRPEGIREIYNALVNKLGNAHDAEHKIGECLVEGIWQAQQHKQAFDEAAYLQRLQKFSTKKQE